MHVTVVSKLQQVVSTASRRVHREGWTILQRAVAAVLAFSLARWLGDNPSPYFAPIAAVVSLNTDIGERGRQALKLLIGVFTGIVTAELTLLVVDQQEWALGISTLVAIFVCTAAGWPRVTSAQAAAAAVLTVSISDGSPGADRLINALIGAGVALVFTQVLFTPNPRRLLQQAESQALKKLADNVRAAADALEFGDVNAGESALTDLRRTRDELAGVHKATDRSHRVARRSLMRQGHRQPLVAETENASHLDLLGDNCVMAVRMGLAGKKESQQRLAGPLHMVAELLNQLAEDPTGTENRQAVVDEVPELLRKLQDLGVRVEAPGDNAVNIARAIGYDIMRFAGVSADEAQRVMEDDAATTHVGHVEEHESVVVRRVRLLLFRRQDPPRPASSPRQHHGEDHGQQRD